jgi:hypothetical protein
VDVNDKVKELVELVETARAMPMSASCVVNRAQMLELLQELRRMLPEVLDQAQRVLNERDAVIEEGRREANRIVAAAHDERGSMISSTDVSREARDAAERIREEAMREAAQIRIEADEYVDQKLANFEVVLTKTLKAVGRGRDKMRGSQNPMDELGRHVQEQDAADAERDYERFGGLDQQHQQPEYDSVEATGAFNARAYQVAEEPYVPHEPYPAEYGQQPAAARSYGAPAAPAASADPYDSGQYGRPGYGEADLAGVGTAYSGESSAAHLLPHQMDTSGAYQMTEYGNTGEYHQLPEAEYAAVPGPDYPADSTSYFDTGLIDVRQFRDSSGYGR